jgi:hypothetical protein
VPNAFSLFGELKLDTSKFTRELHSAERSLKTTQTQFTATEAVAGGLGRGLAGMVNPAALATAGVAALGAAALATATKMWDLLKSTSAYGSEVFDASQKTGLSAKALSALRFAAEQSGSSFEKVTGAVSKFNVLLGEAKLGNEKAAATLAKFGVTATDATKALEQAITAIAKETDVTKQAAAAKALFKDRTAEILPVIA